MSQLGPLPSIHDPVSDSIKDPAAWKRDFAMCLEVPNPKNVQRLAEKNMQQDDPQPQQQHQQLPLDHEQRPQQGRSEDTEGQASPPNQIQTMQLLSNLTLSLSAGHLQHQRQQQQQQ
eukprot:NODE_3020_length_609_cov_67.712500_g2523_i0.p1 GENE.NODE_3020_length_609_cov_67.712500_g2523_i0~~NODE_3020_length_609_cov_67.712500_g2523_i0.p1  ORF type:complete len:135 (-),score=55.98 NODE_3020_length_609_cov_67.712500_g2523_i0:203-553(-)